jgi:hypothetical protein
MELTQRTAGAPARPLPLVAGSLLLAALAFGIAYAVGLRGPGLSVVPIALVLLGAIQGVLLQAELVHRRRNADQWLRHDLSPLSPLHAWRAVELTSLRERRILAGSLRGAVDDLSGRLLPGASPLNRAGVRPHADKLELLAERLADLERPVSAMGILLVQDLLTQGGSPLYDGSRSDDLPAAVGRALLALEPALPQAPALHRLDRHRQTRLTALRRARS